MLMQTSFQYLSLYKQEPRWFERDYEVQEECEFLKAPTISAPPNEILECFEIDPSRLPKAKVGRKPLWKKSKVRSFQC